MGELAQRAWERYCHAEGNPPWLGKADRARFVAGWDAHAGLAEVPHMSAEERARLTGPFREENALVAPKRRAGHRPGSLWALVVDYGQCPSCGSPAGEACRTPSGNRAGFPHAARYRQAGQA